MYTLYINKENNRFNYRGFNDLIINIFFQEKYIIWYSKCASKTFFFYRYS